MSSNAVLILDFGSQVTQLIARRVREANVYCEIHPYRMTLDAIKAFAPKAIILSGGPSSVSDRSSPDIDAGIFALGVPILGICYGQQLMCSKLGGVVESSSKREFGRAKVRVKTESPLFEGVWKQGDEYQVWMSHGDKVTAIPDGFSSIAVTQHTPFAAIADESRQFYGVQFHPEVVHTPEGAALLKRFVCDVAGVEPNWNMDAFSDTKIAEIRQQVGNKHVVCAVSGGVDSSVVATLLHRALGDQLHCIFVDTGCLRKGEAAQVQAMFEDYHINLRAIDASDLFLSRLEGVDDPERKRKIIGAAFIEIFEEEANKLDDVAFLAQGTLYPDVIESVSVHGDASVTIKSHHNVGGLPDRMNLELIEPVRELFKDEVRALGLTLGLTETMIKRHPFPGPGLAIRLPGAIERIKLDILREADAVFIDAIRQHDLYDEIWQAFAVLLPIRTVGVMGDARTYEFVCALRAVTSTDGMTADYYPFDHAFLGEVSTRIINEVKGINRVVYDVTSKPPGTIEWE